VAVGVIGVASLAAILLFNFLGWRTRVLARLLRTDNSPTVVAPPANFQPRVSPGFKVSVFARGFTEPRWLAVAPNGNVFVADSAIGEVLVLHDPENRGIAQSREIFADHLKLPFGIAFRQDYIYVANTNEVVRFRYDPKTSKRLGDAEHILDLPGLGYNQH
jgi:glucose/arabinose dehydrogenase